MNLRERNEAIERELLHGISAREIADKYGISRQRVYQIVHQLKKQDTKPPAPPRPKKPVLTKGEILFLRNAAKLMELEYPTSKPYAKKVQAKLEEMENGRGN